jgi:hypothetical protein
MLAWHEAVYSPQAVAAAAVDAESVLSMHHIVTQKRQTNK